MQNQNFLTVPQKIYVDEANAVSLIAADESLKRDILSNLKATLSNLPEGEQTDKYISELAKMQIQEFKSALNKALHSFASAVISKAKKIK